MSNILKSGAIYKLNGNLLIHADAETIEHIVIPSEPIIKLPVTECNLEEIGEALLQLIPHAKNKIPQPSDLKKAKSDFLRALGVKSFKELHADCVVCMVTYEEDVFSFFPTKNSGREFLIISREPFLTSIAKPLSVGDAAIKALEQCV